ncbi:MAG TPA: hypothetical protein VM029_22750 [Opitutaceae bacterium]|nr:hypothetical protein [Opitutaceae bacterium]
MRPSILCWLALASSAVRLHAEIEFVGLVAMPHKTMFALSEGGSAKTDWVDVGQKFSGYTLQRYDAATDTLTLVKDGVELHVRLRDDAKIKSARLELNGTITLGGGEQVDVTRATLLFDEENVFALKDGTIYRITPQRLPNGHIVYRITVDRTLAPDKTERLSSPKITTLPGQPFALRMGEVGFAFSPRGP